MAVDLDNTALVAGLRDARDADIQNYLGYAYHRLRQFDLAMRHYQQALTLNPRQRSAHEHLGEAHLRKTISPKPKSISQHWSEFASFPATNMMA